MYKVFIYEKPLFIIEHAELSVLPDQLEEYTTEDDFRLADLLAFHEKAVTGTYIVKRQPKKFWKKFKRSFLQIRACGGLVLNANNEGLFIYRNGVWDLPKGKTEKGEKKKTTAIREVEEECGISNPVLLKKICKTYHCYLHPRKGKMVLKDNHWYLMQYEGDEELVPQLEEGITKTEWIPMDSLSEVRGNTFQSILAVLKHYESMSTRINESQR